MGDTRVTPQEHRVHRAALQAGRPGALWALPGLIFFAFFAIVPLLGVIYLSFTEWNALGAPRFIGLANWVHLVSDPEIKRSLGVTVLLLVFGVALQAPISLLLGVWAAGFEKSRAVLSAIFFVPLLLSTAAIAIMWKQLLDPNFGIPSQLARLFGGSGAFLGTSQGAIMTIVIVMGWQFIPFHTVLYQGAARGIPPSLYQAASIDGAGRVRQFFSITLPQLRNTFITSTIFMVVGGLTAFDTVLILTNGGPGTDTAILPFRMYQEAFRNYHMGYGAAIAVVLVVMATALSLLLVRLSGYDKMQSTQEGL